MIEIPADKRDQNAVTEVSRKRALGMALTELALTVSLILSIVMVLAVAGASSTMASTRSDLIMMEESANSALTTMGILALIVVVMGILTILALRDVAPIHNKRTDRTRR